MLKSVSIIIANNCTVGAIVHICDCDIVECNNARNNI